jgi:hypothetical protein
MLLPLYPTIHWLRPAAESQGLGARPLPFGVARWENQWRSRFLHRLKRAGGEPDPEGPTSLEGSAAGGPGATRVGVGEPGGMVASRDASGPWGRPLGPMEILTVRRITGGPMGPVTTKIWRLPSSSSPPPPDDSMTKVHEPVQPGWGNPNHGRRMACPDDPFDGHRGPRATAGSPVGQGKGTRAAPTLTGVAWPKPVVDLQGQPPGDGDGGAGLHGDYDGDGDVGQ